MPSVTSSNIVTNTAQIGDKVITTADIADSAIDTLQIAANAVTDAKIAAHTTTKIITPPSLISNPAGAQGDVLYWNGTAWVRLAAGTSGNSLLTQGAAANPIWGATTMIPNWVDEGRITWTAASADQTLTFTNTGKGLYMILFDIHTRTAGAINMRINSGAGANYVNNVENNASTFTQTTTDTSFALAGSTAAPFGGVMWMNTRQNSVWPSVFCSFLNGGTSILHKGSYNAGDLGVVSSINILLNAVASTGTVHAYSLNL